MRYSLRNLLFAIISGFLLVLTLSLFVNQVTIKAHTRHKEVLTIAYQLLMTTQKIVVEVSSSGVGNLDLPLSEENFNQKLKLLKEYGESEDRPVGDFLIYPSILHENYNNELAAISATWAEFIVDSDRLSNISPSDPEYSVINVKVQDTLGNLFVQVESFSNTLENLDEMQTQNQTKELSLFLGSGLLLLVWGSYVIIFRVIKPLSYLDGVVRGIGQVENIQPIKAMADDELGRLSHSFDTMQMEIYAAQKQLEARVEERTSVLTEAFEFSQEIVSQPDFINLIDSVISRARNLMHAKSVNVCMLTQDMKQLELISRNGNSRTANENSPQQLSQLPMGVLAGIGSAEIEIGTICSNHRMQMSDGCLSIPLYTGGRVIGAICVMRDKGLPFTDIENHTLKLLANSAAVAIANIRLAEDSRKQAELNATLNERQRLTSELHDEAAQTLSLLNLKVGELDHLLSDGEKETTSTELEQFKRLIERAQAQMRMAFSGMNSTTAHKNNDIRKELTDYVKEFSDSSGIAVDLVVGDLSSLVLPALIQKQAMYIYREALTNVRRYANAKKVRVQLEYVNEMLQIVISDDGRGFDPNISKSDHHLGLAVMQARTERVGGTLSIETAPGAGTRVIAHIPILKVTSMVIMESVN